MRIINAMADKMLSTLVPGITAQAGVVCSPYQYEVVCGCVNGFFRYQWVYVNTKCAETRGPCDLENGTKCT
jgi:hypothetical protein